jgi:hypothetical protein
MQVTHTNILCWAISHQKEERARTEAQIPIAQKAKAKTMESALKDQLRRYDEILKTLTDLYKVETGKDYGDI